MAERGELVNFVSKRHIESGKEDRKKAREEILRKAQEKYEKEERRKEQAKARGEDTWILSSVSARVEDETKEHSKKKKKKHKHEKKRKKKSKNKSDEESTDEWVEKSPDPDQNSPDQEEEVQEMETDEPPITSNNQPTERDSWMLCPSIMMATSRKEEREAKRREEEKEEKPVDKLGTHERELNPYWKGGGTGLPPEQQQKNSASPKQNKATAAKLAWLKRSFKRAKEQAEQDGKSLEEVAAARWGSLETIESMIAAAERDLEESSGDDRRHRSQGGHADVRGQGSRHRHRDYDERRGSHDRPSDRSKDRDRGAERREPARDDDRERRRDDNRERRGHDRDREGSRWRKPREMDEERNAESRITSRHDDDKERKPNFARPDSSSSQKFSGMFKRPGSSETSRMPSSHSKSSESGKWRKKTAETSTTTSSESAERTVVAETSKPPPEKETESSSEEEEEEEEEEERPVLPQKKVTDTDLNALGAKILKAELMGNEAMVSQLKTELESLRQVKAAQEAEAKRGTVPAPRQPEGEQTVLLTKTDRHGNQVPVHLSEPSEPSSGKRKKRKLMSTHGADGTRERYFTDDDQHDLKDLVVREKMSSAEDYNSMLSRLSSKALDKVDSEYFTLDDHFVDSAAKKFSAGELEERERQKAIKEHRKLAEQLSKCRFCFENPDLAKHLIVAIGMKVYLALPLHESLTPGHCLIIPMQHTKAVTIVDEDVWSEIQIFKKGLTKMFEDMDQDVIFMEMCKNWNQQHHLIIECVPMPKEEGDMAPIYFKKAIQESDTEWSQNKKLIDTRTKGLRSSVPKGLPYFSVEFGLDGGFAHVIEDDTRFPHYFGKEIIGGMLDIDPHHWRKPHRENFQEHKKKVLQFAEWWKPFDWTQRLKEKSKSN